MFDRVEKYHNKVIVELQTKEKTIIGAFNWQRKTDLYRLTLKSIQQIRECTKAFVLCILFFGRTS